MNASRLLRFSLLTALFLLGVVRADNWPQWRGLNNDGISNEKNLPTEWSATKNIAWKVKLPGAGGATPIVWGERIFLTSEDGKDLVLLAISTEGKELWKRNLGKATPWARSDEGNGASPTPSTDGKHVFVMVGNGTFAAFDLDGREIWRFDVQERYGKFRIAFGIHSTPVLYGDRIYQQLIHDGGATVFCIDKSTGENVWKVTRPSDGTGENKHSYASAFLWKNGKDAYLVCHGNDYATAHDLRDGKEIWRVGELNPKDKYRFDLRFVASPVCTPELIVIPSAKNHGVVGLKPTAQGMVKAGSEFEQWRMTRGTPDVPCPLVHEGLVYLAGEGGTLTVLDAKSGSEYYRKPVHGHRHRASPVLADGKVYLTARDGTCSVVKAGKEFEKLATNKLPDQTASSPAVANGRIYLRGFEHLWAIGTK